VKTKFNGNPFKFVYNFMCIQTALNIIFGLLIVVMLWGTLRTRDNMLVVMDGTDKAIASSINIAKKSLKESKDLRKLEANLAIVEAMQIQIIARSPELYKQHKEMFSMVELEILSKTKKELEKIKKRMKEVEKGVNDIIPKKSGLKLELNNSGEYPI
jgi:hypothetical protein